MDRGSRSSRLSAWLPLIVSCLAGCDPSHLVDAARAARNAAQAAAGDSEPPRPSTPIPVEGTTRAGSEDAALECAWFERNFVGAYRRVDFAPEWELPRTPDAQVGFGAYLDDNTVVVRYRDVRLRRLAGPPAAPSPRP